MAVLVFRHAVRFLVGLQAVCRVNAVVVDEKPIGRHKRHAWLASGAVGVVAQIDRRLAVVNTIDEHAMSSQHFAVPSFVLDVLQDDVFIVGVRTDADKLVVVERHLCSVAELGYVGPFHDLAFPWCVGCRGVAVVGIFTSIHQVPILHGLIVDALCGLCVGVHVGQSKRMRKLMAEQADAVDALPRCLAEFLLGGIVEFAMQSIAAHALAIVSAT